ncbi:creatininase family protein [Roseomonas rosulenta]|uniref:creatininase family protein n=1 Tax=Roseomonas rosulenta TaxID=2748667 RepID=UPI0018DF5F9F|nr:creatininase family protein [Roseomonas rosulenta]
MRIAESNWRDVEAYLAKDDRCVLPFGSTEQHAGLSLCVDAILAERVALEAAEPLGVPVFPVMPFGLAPYFAAYPGSISLRVETLLAVTRDLSASVAGQGFRRILIVNGHGGNAPIGALAQEIMAENPRLSIKFHNWWNAPATWAAAQAEDTTASHGNWFENFPWTRLAHAPAPEGAKPGVDLALMKASPPARVRDMLGDGSFGGAWQKPDAVMARIWAAGVAETRAALEGPWG